MDTRKIQQVSNGTFTVSLPKDWANAEGITTGTVVDLHTHIDGVLVIQPPEGGSDPIERVTLRPADADPGHLEQILRAAYAAGPKEVALEFDGGATPAQRQTARRVVRNLVGVTITEASDTQIVVRNVLDANEVSIRQSVRQLRFVSLSMHRDATAALVDGRPPGEMTGRDDRADRLYAMVERHYGRGIERLDEIDALGETREELLRLHETARELERIADHAERIGEVAATVDDPVPEPVRDEVADVAEETHDAVESAVDIVFDGASAETAREVLHVRDRVCDRLDSLERRVVEDHGGDYRYVHALHALRRTAEHATNVAEVGLRTAVHRGDLDETGIDEEVSGTGGRASSV
ncbi:phosphate uptake regulator PhoU [Haloferax profundi]|uniref:Transcriptional regulator n=1 Tax=Haloferax profundi TaxID=1544718 RepID=A0A0W1SWQ2_9EURY|nr:phosphate uptake regulator PhoU [Haloferax profundi]KTG30672.1 transcriptional regulator [Haloferax profundi]